MAVSLMHELFAGELRLGRTAAGLSQEGLAQQISYSTSLVAMVEQCRRIPRPEFAERCDEVLDTGGLLSRIREKLGQEVLLHWFREWVEIEREATMLRSFEPLVVPGLMQTEEYARALHVGASPLTGDEMEQQVAARMERQRIFDREKPPTLVAVLDESVLRRSVGGPIVMAEQLRHLVELSHRPNVHLHVVPASAEAYPGLNGPFALATPTQGDEVAYLDTQLQGHVASRPADVLSLRGIWESVLGEALPQRRSIELIEEAAKAWN